MSPEELFGTAIGLQAPWHIDTIEYEQNEVSPWISVLHLHLSYDPGYSFLDESGKRCPIYDHVKRKWRHLNFFQHECYIYADIPRITSADGSVTTIDVPWARSGSSFTLMMEAYCMTIARSGMSLPQVGKLVGLDSRVIGRMIGHAVEEGLQKTPLAQVKQLSIDETSSKKGHNYLTILSDAKEKKVVGLGVGKNKEAVVAGIQEMESRGSKANSVREVAIDLSPAYTSAVLEYFEGASLVYDRFHVEQLLSKALDTVRKLERKECAQLRNTKYMWLRNYRDLKEEDQLIVEYLGHLYPTVGKAYQLKEQFKEVWEQPTAAKGIRVLRAWMRMAMQSKLQPIMDFVKTLQSHWSGIIAYFNSRLNNGYAERLNLVIQEIKRRGRGYRNIHNFMRMIYFHCGKLYLPVYPLKTA